MHKCEKINIQFCLHGNHRPAQSMIQTDAVTDMPAFSPLLTYLSPSCLRLTEQSFLLPHGLNMCIYGNKRECFLCRRLTLHATSANTSLRHFSWRCQECSSGRCHYLQGILRVHQYALALYTEHQTGHQEKLLYMRCSLLVLSI